MIKENISLDFSLKKNKWKKKLLHRRNKTKRFHDQEEQKSFWNYKLR